MKNFLLICLIGSALFSCQKKNDSLKEYSPAERDSLLADIVTFVYNPPIEATTQTRFDTKFRKYYVKQINNFKLEKYFVNKMGVNFFYVIRPARSAQGKLRGVGGFFKRDGNGKIISFKEVFNTPVLALTELQQRGGEIFQMMIQEGNIEGYLKNPDYVEWPSKYLHYDTIRYEWIPVN